MPKKNYINIYQDQRLTNVEKHIEVINGELSSIKTDIAQVKTDVCWLKWWMKLTAGAAISGLIIGLINLLVR